MQLPDRCLVWYLIWRAEAYSDAHKAGWDPVLDHDRTRDSVSSAKALGLLLVGGR